MEHQRSKTICEAATRLFLRQGYGKTQIDHIAQAVGVSVGTIYNEFAGKQEILHAVLKSAIDPEFLDRALPRPLSDEVFGDLEGELAAAFQHSAERFSSRLSTGLEDYGLEELVSDAFDLLSRHAAGCLFIEKNQFDFPRLAERYRAYRAQIFYAMTRYMAAFVDRGEVRPLNHLELTTHLMIETLSWWAMDVRYISFETREIPAGLAKEVCMDNIVSAYRARPEWAFNEK